MQGLTQIRYDSPLWMREQPRARLAQLSDAALSQVVERELSEDALEVAMAPITAWCDAQRGPGWEQIAEVANSYLDLTCWAAPPWSGEQWNTLAMVLSLAEQEANGDA